MLVLGARCWWSGAQVRSTWSLWSLGGSGEGAPDSDVQRPSCHHHYREQGEQRDSGVPG